jgi:hypothetical protein
MEKENLHFCRLAITKADVFAGQLIDDITIRND